jgi:hypothetical protein
MFYPRTSFYLFLCVSLLSVEILQAQSIDETHRRKLPGNVHSLARKEFDQAAAPPELRLER